jgi:hypothetical protein
LVSRRHRGTLSAHLILVCALAPFCYSLLWFMKCLLLFLVSCLLSFIVESYTLLVCSVIVCSG